MSWTSLKKVAMRCQQRGYASIIIIIHNGTTAENINIFSLLVFLCHHKGTEVQNKQYDEAYDVSQDLSVNESFDGRQHHHKVNSFVHIFSLFPFIMMTHSEKRN